MERIEILHTDTLYTHRPLAEQFRELAERLGIALGWHYLLDFAWAASKIDLARPITVMDAGAASGLMQWWLAEAGVKVISVDRTSRAALPWKLRNRYHVVGMRPEDLLTDSPAQSIRGFLPSRYPQRWKTYPAKLRATLDSLCAHRQRDQRGIVRIYNQDLRTMPDIEPDSVDAVVSISALEHNPPDELKACVSELMRVLKPGGTLVATLAAARNNDWYHEPSKGWCYTEATLRDIFGLRPDSPSNYDHYDELFTALRDCAELRDNLADFYFRSGNNGMPWGVWDPKYQPVGVLRVKRKE